MFFETSYFLVVKYVFVFVFFKNKKLFLKIVTKQNINMKSTKSNGNSFLKIFYDMIALEWHY